MDYPTLCKFESLALATADRPLILILDSLDQLSEEDAVQGRGGRGKRERRRDKKEMEGKKERESLTY
jgi:hypothetical protein